VKEIADGLHLRGSARLEVSPDGPPGVVRRGRSALFNAYAFGPLQRRQVLPKKRRKILDQQGRVE